MNQTHLSFQKLVLKTGARDSRLSRIQTEFALSGIKALCPDGFEFPLFYMKSPGDRDQKSDLRITPDDFFTRDLDEALRRGEIDIAVHSAKDLPPKLADDFDFGWLPWREDPSDALILREGETLAELPENPRIGVSSIRREEWCLKKMPGCVLEPVRGVIEDRLSKLDRGEYDALLMATAALNRLGLQHRITLKIPQDEMELPDGQGVLAITFLKDHPVAPYLRNLFVPSVILAGAGAGRAGTATIETVNALLRAEVCICDALLDRSLLSYLPAEAIVIEAGKRCGSSGSGQNEINEWIVRYARRGFRVVRLKGGDPGIFGRLSEEVTALDEFHLPYVVYPGISSFQTASTGTGMLLTKRSASRGFSILTARKEAGKEGRYENGFPALPELPDFGTLPKVFFMGLHQCESIFNELISKGADATTPAAAVFWAGSSNEEILKGTLGSLPKLIEARNAFLEQGDTGRLTAPALLMTGEHVPGYYKGVSAGPLFGKKILITGSALFNSRAEKLVIDLGGKPILFPLIELSGTDTSDALLQNLSDFNLVIVTSPSSVGFFIQALLRIKKDLRAVQKIAVCGKETGNALRRFGIEPDFEPVSDYGAAGLIELLKEKKVLQTTNSSYKVLRVASDRAAGTIGSFLAASGADLYEAVLYKTKLRQFSVAEFPDADILFFASPSAVFSLSVVFPGNSFSNKVLLPIGRPTAKAMEECGLTPYLIPSEADPGTALRECAAKMLVERFQ